MNILYGYPNNCLQGKLPSWLRLGCRLGLALQSGLAGNFPQGQLSQNPLRILLNYKP